MEIKFIKEEKNELDIEMDSLTLAELLRAYLNEEGLVDVAAWKREHPMKNPVLHIEADNPKSAVKKAIAAIEKDVEKVLEEFKKLK
ncbi:MAG: RpoL/Rpb11 RNA polymerase subunit family protein [archaeon]